MKPLTRIELETTIQYMIKQKLNYIGFHNEILMSYEGGVIKEEEKKLLFDLYLKACEECDKFVVYYRED